MNDKTLALYADWKHTQAQVCYYTRLLMADAGNPGLVTLVKAYLAAEQTAHDVWHAAFTAETTPAPKGN